MTDALPLVAVAMVVALRWYAVPVDLDEQSPGSAVLALIKRLIIACHKLYFLHYVGVTGRGDVNPGRQT